MLDYFTIRTAPHTPGSHWLVTDIGDPDLREALIERLKQSPGSGRSRSAPTEVALLAELEGKDSCEDYSNEEIARSKEGIPLPYRGIGDGVILCREDFVAELEREHGKFRAIPISCIHPSTRRRWDDFWLVFFTARLPLVLLRDDSKPVLVGKADGVVSLRTAVVTKAPTIGACYDANSYLERILARYSDATGEGLMRAIDADPAKSFFYERDETGALDGIGVSPDGPVAKLLSKRRR